MQVSGPVYSVMDACSGLEIMPAWAVVVSRPKQAMLINRAIARPVDVLSLERLELAGRIAILSLSAKEYKVAAKALPSFALLSGISPHVPASHYTVCRDNTMTLSGKISRATRVRHGYSGTGLAWYNRMRRNAVSRHR
jgi:hypothetical protein